MSRVALTTSPMLPSKCVVCTKDADGTTQFADFAADLDYYGAIVICEHCVRECIELLDAPVAELRAKLVAKEEEFEALQNEYRELRTVINTINSYRESSIAVNSIAVTGDSASEESTGEASKPAPAKGSKSAKSNPDADESDSSGGLENSSLFAG